MAFAVGTNSWASVEEADALLGDRIGTGAWFALDESPASPGDESKQGYLIIAFDWLSGAYGIAASDGAADALKKAQSLAAFWLIGNREEYEKRQSLIAGGVEEFKWSRWEETLADSTEIPSFISDIMIGLGVGGSNQVVQLYGDDYEDA